MWQAISQQLSDTLLFNFQITERTKVPGGDINDCYMISDGNERYFVKVNQREFLPKFVRQFADVHSVILKAANEYHQTVVEKNFPSHTEIYH